MASVRSIKSALEEESDDLTHCCICMEQFDNGLHKPKFLICHHTLCLQCIKVFHIYSQLYLQINNILIIFQCL